MARVATVLSKDSGISWQLLGRRRGEPVKVHLERKGTGNEKLFDTSLSLKGGPLRADREME